MQEKPCHRHRLAYTSFPESAPVLRSIAISRRRKHPTGKYIMTYVLKVSRLPTNGEERLQNVPV